MGAHTVRPPRRTGGADGHGEEPGLTTTHTSAKPERATAQPTPEQQGPPPTPTGTGLGTRPRPLGAPRGRHRRPRPRKVLFAAGGLALAAGVLSLVRLAPDPGIGGPGTAEAGPHPEGTGTTAGPERTANAAATVAAVPKVSPSATTALGGPGTTPVPGASATPTATTRSTTSTTDPAPAHPADPTTLPQTPNTPAAPATPRPSTATSAAPAPTPSRTSTPAPQQPAPAPAETSQPGLCVPIIGVCVDPPGRQG